jgi:uncharacterized protein YjbI with pentapeptide repeats
MMKTSALAISLILILVPLAGCLGNDDSRIGCPDSPPEGTTCVPNRTVFATGNDALDLVYAKEVNLSGFDLRDADFSGAILSYADLSGADLSGADLSGSIIRGAKFINATITGTNFEGAIYDEHTFWYSGWNDKDGDGILDEGRVPDHIKEKMIYFGPESNLDGINLDGRHEISFWPARTIDGIVFPGSIPANLSHSSLRGTSMSGIELGLILTNFSNADLTDADFSKSALILTDFSNADLTGVNFSEAELRYADLSGVDLSRGELYDISALALLGCPSNLPEGWLCIADPLMDSCPVSEEGDDREEYVQLMGDLLDSLDLSYCPYYILGPTSSLTIWIENVDLTGLDLSVRPPEAIRAANLTGCPSSLFEGYVCTGGAILGPNVRLADADLSGVDLTGVDLSGSMVVEVNLSDADLTGAILDDIFWKNTICPDGTNSDDNGDTCANNL